MPLYEYRCLECNQSLEVIQKFSDPELVACSECGGSLERVVSAPAIRFKGAGWYVNDYASKSSGNSSQKKSEESGEKASKPESKNSSESRAKNSSKVA